MKNMVWVGVGFLVGIGVGFIIKVSLEKKEDEQPVMFKRFDQKGDFALRDTERALSRADF